MSSHIKEAPWKVIVVYLLVSTCLVALINLALFPSSFFDPITKATYGLINATLQANLLNILVFSILIFGWGRLRPSDVGLVWSKLPLGLPLTALLWLVTQGIVLLINWINGEIRIDPVWSERGVTVVIGGLIAQLCGNAFFEEMEYRGFYLGQFYLKIKNPNERVRLALAILSMLALFVFSHIPNRIFCRIHPGRYSPGFCTSILLGIIFHSRLFDLGQSVSGYRCPCTDESAGHDHGSQLSRSVSSFPVDQRPACHPVGPETQDRRVDDLDAAVYADGALPRKVKLLMAMAFDAADGAPGGVRDLGEEALEAGASKAEIAEALRVAFHLSGAGCLYTASFALKDIRE